MASEVATELALDHENPWPGLNSYDETAAGFFNGREFEIGELKRLILQAPLTVLFGKSGLGKTSLLKAGLFPALGPLNMLPIYVRFEFSESGQTTPLIDQLAEAFDEGMKKAGAEAPHRSPDQTFWEYLHRIDFRIWSAQNQPLVPVFVFDQFEEVLTLGGGDAPLIDAWKDDLADLVENRIPTTVERALADGRADALALKQQSYRMLLSFREDFATVFERWVQLPSLMRNRFQLLPMSADQALRAVRNSGGALIDGDVAAAIVRFVAGAQREVAAGAAGAPAPEAAATTSPADLLIEPALLSLVCLGLNERRKSAGRPTIESGLLNEAARGLIDRYYDECMGDQPERVHRFVEHELITESGFRKPCARDDASRPPYYVTWEEIGILVQRRLLRVLASPQVSRVELIHDLLGPTVLARRNRRRRDPKQFSDALRRVRGPVARGAREHDRTAITCRVVNADLAFETAPLLVGHYESSVLRGSEARVNHLIGGAMSQALRAGIYPLEPGTHQIFRNARPARELSDLRPPTPPYVIVVGLGKEGSLRTVSLRQTVRQAVIAWIQRLEEQPHSTPQIRLAATLIGSGGAGMSPGHAAQCVAQGVQEANEMLAKGNIAKRVAHLQFVETFSDRAELAWRALQTLAVSSPANFVVEGAIVEGPDAIDRPLSFGYRGTNWDLLRVQTEKGERPHLEFEYYTSRQTDAVRCAVVLNTLVRDLVTSASNDARASSSVGATLYSLLIPPELDALLGGGNELRLDVDDGTARLPWELLEEQTSLDSGQLPWAIRRKVIRAFSGDSFRRPLANIADDIAVLIVGAPLTDSLTPKVFGAQEEAHEVARTLLAPIGDDRIALLAPADLESNGPDAATVMGALLERQWRVVHLAGHLQRDITSAGLLLSNGAVLGPAEFAAMRTLPELVFVSGCYQAANDNLLESVTPDDRVAVAAGLAGELLRIGVRCVVVSGWLVDDVAAHVFARTFYAALARGERFADAVGAARQQSYEVGGPTWAAFQCYGDPDWTLRPAPLTVVDAHLRSPLAVPQIASSKALVLALKTLATRFSFSDGRPTSSGVEEIQELEQRYAAQWGHSGATAEAFGDAYRAASDIPRAIEWYERALACDDGTASLRVIERLGNLRTRIAWTQVTSRFDPTSGEEQLLPRHVLVEARRQINDALGLFDRLIGLFPTVERECLYAAGLKRLAMVELIARNAAAAEKAVVGMAAHYELAVNLARMASPHVIIYPAMNYLAAQLWLHAGKAGSTVAEPALFDEIQESIGQADVDFWNVLAGIELAMYRAVASGTLSSRRKAILSQFTDLNKRAGAPILWRSVYESAFFVLQPYANRAGKPAERTATTQLLNALRRFSE